VVQATNKTLLEKFGISHTTLQVEPEKKVSFKLSSNDPEDRGTTLE
jgi:hypothetical protein